MAMVRAARKAYPAVLWLLRPCGTGGTPEAETRVRARWVNGLIGVGHFMSHYYPGTAIVPLLWPVRELRELGWP